MDVRAWLRLYGLLKDIYDEATSSVSGRIATYTAGFLAQDAAKRKLLASGMLDKNKYGQWLKNNVFSGMRWKTILFRVIRTMLNANRKATRIIEDEQKKRFKDGANRQLHDLEKQTGTDSGVDLYTDDYVTRLLKERPELLPRRKGDENRERGWMQDRIAVSIAQSIIAGEGVMDAAKRLGKALGDSNMHTMVRYARTALTCATNAGTLDSMRRAAAMGIHVRKRWLATLDERTRNSHRALDGQVRELNQDFNSPLGRIAYPGDITANPSDVWNCRCTMTYVYPDYSELIKNPQRRENVAPKRVIQDMNYREWEEYKKTGTPPKKPEEPSALERKLRDTGEVIMSYIADEFDRQAQEHNDKIAQLTKRESELLSQYSKLHRGPERAEIVKELADISEQRAELLKDDDKYTIESIAEQCKKQGIEFVPVTKMKTPRTEEEIITRLAGGDLTDGSCASVGFAYAGQKAGLDVLDFRGGASRKKFSFNCVDLLKSFEKIGLPVQKSTARSYITAGKHTLGMVEEGKQYYFECAEHAAVVRRTNGKLEYLELQSGVKNGWKPFADVPGILNWRFGAPKNSVGADVKTYMVEIDALAGSERFLKLMGYINTRPEDQQKGTGGHER